VSFREKRNRAIYVTASLPVNAASAIVRQKSKTCQNLFTVFSIRPRQLMLLMIENRGFKTKLPNWNIDCSQFQEVGVQEVKIVDNLHSGKAVVAVTAVDTFTVELQVIASWLMSMLALLAVLASLIVGAVGVEFLFTRGSLARAYTVKTGSNDNGSSSSKA
jgi:hypothetical protein